MCVRTFVDSRMIACVLLASVVTACDGSRDAHSEQRAQRADAAQGNAAIRPAAPDGAPGQPGGPPRIVVLGDSLTAGLGLPMDEAYPALLQQRIDAKGLRFQVVN